MLLLFYLQLCGTLVHMTGLITEDDLGPVFSHCFTIEFMFSLTGIHMSYLTFHSGGTLIHRAGLLTVEWRTVLFPYSNCCVHAVVHTISCYCCFVFQLCGTLVHMTGLITEKGLGPVYSHRYSHVIVVFSALWDTCSHDGTHNRGRPGSCFLSPLFTC